MKIAPPAAGHADNGASFLLLRGAFMKRGITFKLFLAILVACMAIALAMATAVRASFNHGFLGYLNQQEAQRVGALIPTFANAYARHGSWDFLRDNPRAWFSLLRPPGASELIRPIYEVGDKYED